MKRTVCTQYILALCLTVLALGQATQGARILALFPIPATSHQNVLTALTKGLAEKGHDLTVVTPVPLKKQLSNYKEIIVPNFMKTLLSKEGINFYDMSKTSAVTTTVMLWGMGNALCEMILPDPQIQALIHSNASFDLVLVEACYNDCLLGFSHTFQAPVIQISPIGGGDIIGDATGNPTPFAHVPDFTLNFDHRMNFSQRFYNTLLGIFKILGRNLFYMPRQNSLMQEYFKGTGPGPVPHISKLTSRTSLMLLNDHVSISSPRPYLPNVIEVGGMHISSPKELPQDLQKYLDDAKEGGVIYFSMGSNIQGSDMPDSKRDAFLTAFSKLKQKVLWKWETESLPEQPKNVKLGKWFPQSDLLAHPNVKLFITHGGLLSTQEALYHGMPIIGIPIFGDQPMNMKRAVTAGYAVKLDFDNVTTEGLSAALKEVLDNPKYRETAQTLSRVFRDQPQTPLETAVFWTEYVLRHKGAHHLRSAAQDLCWFQYHLLDVLAVLGAGVLAVMLIAYFTLRTLLRCILPSKKKTQVNAGKKKS